MRMPISCVRAGNGLMDDAVGADHREDQATAASAASNSVCSRRSATVRPSRCSTVTIPYGGAIGSILAQLGANRIPQQCSDRSGSEPRCPSADRRQAGTCRESPLRRGAVASCLKPRRPPSSSFFAAGSMPYFKRLPIGSCPGQNRRAISSLITTTGGAPGARSLSCNSRPRSSGMRIASK